ncbi:toll/interleukin-1 receptor domain-containing protein [Aquabacterium humicola]|uniref:toll/interleukin-1 receptor domain-containing protein n=1 Tax=Aquabacterium humicola TaxID=3237377 RepID=UPI0025427489|nr:toll/interleukin-1 receptor domain-containing protein [Rubrivivax pictus]
MKVFVSHSHDQADDADELALALRAAGHHAVLDRDVVAPGGEFHARLRLELQSSDLALFMVTPDAMRKPFVRSEIEFARDRWPSPVDRVLPVMWHDTPLADIPNYLKTVSVRKPVGHKVAEVVAWVDAIAARQAAAVPSAPPAPPPAPPPSRGWRAAAVAGSVAAVGLVAWAAWTRVAEPAPCLMRLSVLTAPEAPSSVDFPTLASRRSFLFSGGVALPDFVGLTRAPDPWTLQLVLPDGRLGATFQFAGCPTTPMDKDDGHGTRIRLEPRR